MFKFVGELGTRNGNDVALSLRGLKNAHSVNFALDKETNRVIGHLESAFEVKDFL